MPSHTPSSFRCEYPFTRARVRLPGRPRDAHLDEIRESCWSAARCRFAREAEARGSRPSLSMPAEARAATTSRSTVRFPQGWRSRPWPSRWR